MAPRRWSGTLVGMVERPRRVVTVFRSRLRPDAEANGYGELAARMERRARSMPGLLDFKTFVAQDGERVSIVVFESRDSHDAWRDDPEHRAAQRLGRDGYYAEYSISVCEERANRSFDARNDPGHDDHRAVPGSQNEPG